MLSKLIIALFVATTAQAGQNLRLLENECTDANGLVIDCDTQLEEQE